MKLYQAASRLDQENRRKAEEEKAVLAVVRERCKIEGVRKFAQRVGVDAGNLVKVLAGRRRLGKGLLSELTTKLNVAK